MNSAANGPSRKRAGLSAAIALVLAALVLFGLEFATSPFASAAPAATCTWSPGKGVWSDASRWSCGIVPGANDTAIVASGTVTLDVPVNIGSLVLNSQISSNIVITEGVIAGSQPLTIVNSLQWYGGKLTGGGLTTIDVSATAIISRQYPTGAGNPDNGLRRPIWNRGVVSLTGGTVGSDAAAYAVFTNTGTFNALKGVFYPASIRNEGLLVKSSPGLANLGSVPAYVLRNYGQVVVNEGTLFSASTVQLSGTTTLNGGTIYMNTGQYSVQGGTFRGSGALVGTLSIESGGILAPGASAGAIQVIGQYQQLSGSTLNIEIGGHDLKDYDVLLVDGSAVFNGSTIVNISLINGYSPSLIDGFTIVRYSSRGGLPATVNNAIAATHPFSYSNSAMTLGNPHPRPFQSGDLFVSSTTGRIKQFDRDGRWVGVLDPKLDGNPLAGAGMCFDGNGNLIATQFGAFTVSKFNVAGQLISSTFGTGYTAEPESCVFDAAGNFYVGQANVIPIPSFPARIQKRNGVSGAFMDLYTATQTERGTDWIELKPDGRTILYTSEGPEVLAYDVLSQTQRPVFASGLLDPCFALRVRPNSEVMLACEKVVYRLSSSGGISATYTITSLGETDPSGLFALNLDSDGTSFWTAGIGSGKLYKVDIASGTVLTVFQSHPFTRKGGGGPESLVVGLAVYGEIQVSRPNLTLVETVGVSPSGCAGTREITVAPGTTVYYCYTILNTGVVTLSTHSLTDTVFGPIFTNQPITLTPGATTFLTRTATITTPTINVATWTGTNGAQSASGSDFTRVNIGVVLDKNLYLPLIQR